MSELDRYFKRIGVTRPGQPNLAALREIVAAHTRTIAFENLDAFTGREPGLDLDSLVAKLVDGGRGGWCFEHNMLLRHALDELGYPTVGLSGRVRRRLPSEAPPAARSHMLIRVELPEGSHLVDVGFGGLTLTGVLALQADIAQPTPHEPFRIVTVGAELDMQARLDAEWETLYRFDLTPQADADYEVGNFYLSHSPRSAFRDMLTVARAGEGLRYTLADRTLTTHHLNGPSEKRTSESVPELRGVLEDVFELELSGVDGVDDALARLFAGLSPA